MNFSRDEVKTKLKQIPIFKKLATKPEAMDRIVEVLTPVTIPQGQEIIKEGDQGNEMYILLEGEIEISKLTMEKEPYTVAKLKDSMNIFFGELALVDQDKRSATVRATTGCTLLCFSREKFYEISQQHNDIGWDLTIEIAGILAGRLRKANEDAVILFEALVNEIKSA